MLAAIALVLCTVVLFKMKRERFAWVTVVPATWLVACTVTAGLEKVFNPNPAVGFLAPCLADSRRAIAAGQVLAPAHSLSEMSRLVFNDYVDATLAALFAAVVVARWWSTASSTSAKRWAHRRRPPWKWSSPAPPWEDAMPDLLSIKFAEWKERGQAVKSLECARSAADDRCPRL